MLVRVQLSNKILYLDLVCIGLFNIGNGLYGENYLHLSNKKFSKIVKLIGTGTKSICLACIAMKLVLKYSLQIFAGWPYILQGGQ